MSMEAASDRQRGRRTNHGNDDVSAYDIATGPRSTLALTVAVPTFADRLPEQSRVTSAVVSPSSVSEGARLRGFPLSNSQLSVLKRNCVARSGGVAIFVLKSNRDLGLKLVVVVAKDRGLAGGKNRTAHI